MATAELNSDLNVLLNKWHNVLLHKLLSKYSKDISNLLYKHNRSAIQLPNEENFERTYTSEEIKEKSRKTYSMINEHIIQLRALYPHCSQIKEISGQLTNKQATEMLNRHESETSKLVIDLIGKANGLVNQVNSLFYESVKNYFNDAKCLLQDNNSRIEGLFSRHTSEVNQLLESCLHEDTSPINTDPSSYSLFPELNLQRKKFHKEQIVDVDDLVKKHNISREEILFHEDHGRVEPNKTRHLWFSFKATAESRHGTNVFGLRYREEAAGAACHATDSRLPQAPISERFSRMTLEKKNEKPANEQTNKLLTSNESQLSKVQAIGKRVPVPSFTKICIENLSNSCNIRCSGRHANKSFAWDVQGPDGYWYECHEDIGIQLEQAYSVPNLKQSVLIDSPTSIFFDFVSMTYKFTNMSSLPLRRISTKSSCSDESLMQNNFTTEYKWIFMNDKNFCEEFGVRNTDRASDCVNSDYVERNYVFVINHEAVIPSGTTFWNSIINYEIVNYNKLWSYQLDFSTMQQTNKQTGVVRSVFRRPIHRDRGDPVYICLRHCSRPGSCYKGSNCPNLHVNVPYYWQYRQIGFTDRWRDYRQSYQEDLEKQYCNVVVDQHEVSVNGDALVLDFDDLLARPKNTLGVPKYEFRRIATTARWNVFDDALLPFTNSYQWHWVKKEREKPYFHNELENILNVEELPKPERGTYPFKLQRLSANGGIYVNSKTNFSRLVRRRPVFVLGRKFGDFQVRFPREWDMLSMEDYLSSAGFLTIELEKNGEDSAEYTAVAGIADYGVRSRIYQIWRIQNVNLFQDYWMKKTAMEQVHGPGSELERRLFHGTLSKSINFICQDGFDVSRCGEVWGSFYGKGTYFATRASYSLDCYVEDTIDRKNSKCLLVVKVLVGKYTVGKREMSCAPLINENDPNGARYDTTVNNVKNPGEFVTYSRAQAYPAYLICIRSS